MSFQLKRFLSLALQGFLALFPIIITLYLGALVLSWINDTFQPILLHLPGQLENGFAVIAVNLVILLAFLSLLAIIGITVRSLIGRAMLRFVRNAFSVIPGLGVIYKAAEQVISVAASEKKGFFVNPVLVEYPSPGIWAIAFNTGAFDQEETQYTVFIPTTPNPTSGFLAIVTKEKVREYPASVEDAVKMVLTGGLVKNSSPMEL